MLVKKGSLFSAYSGVVIKSGTDLKYKIPKISEWFSDAKTPHHSDVLKGVRQPDTQCRLDVFTL